METLDAGSCVFCELLSTDSATWVARRRDAVAFAPLREGQLAPGHTLVVPRRHCVGVYDAEPSHLAATIELVQRVSQAMLGSLDASGVNVLNASGPASGQSVPHLHFHVVPRWSDDGAEMWPSDKAVHELPGDPYRALVRKISEFADR
jgi:histidine triad (HIT) family protein